MADAPSLPEVSDVPPVLVGAAVTTTVPPCRCGDCLSCDMRALRARAEGTTPDELLEREQTDYRVAVRAVEAMAGVL
jgi:hypothetical protein